ncbi:MAG: hypothetical protein LUC91_07150, partial [Prevotella sp.]|nr:hypothetical protein [Prevotella sp.]
VTLFEIVTGDLPFFGQGGGMQLHGAELPQIKTNFSDELKSIISACLQKDTWDRPTAQQLYDYAVAMIDGQQVTLQMGHQTQTIKLSGEENKNDGNRPTSSNRSFHREKPNIKEIIIWSITVGSLISTVVFTLLAYLRGYFPCMVVAITEIIVCVGGLMLLRKSKLGFWFISIPTVLGTLWLCLVMPFVGALDIIMGVFLILNSIIGIPVLVKTLNKSSDDQYSWHSMKYKLSPAVTIIMIAVFIGIVTIVCIDSIKAINKLDRYNVIIEDCDRIMERDFSIYGDPISDSLIFVKNNLFLELKNMENRFAYINPKYRHCISLARDYNIKTIEKAEYLVKEADECLNKEYDDYYLHVRYLANASYYYNSSLSYNENDEVRDKFRKTYADFLDLASEQAYLNPWIIGIYGENDQEELTYYKDKKLYANKICYLYVDLEYEAFDRLEDHDVYLTLRLYNNGVLMCNSTRYSSSYTIEEKFTITQGIDNVLWFSWGSEDYHIYDKGSLRAEIWYGDTLIKKASFTLY